MLAYCVVKVNFRSNENMIMKKILVPCDFSNTAVQAFRFACQVAALSKGEVFLLNVIELPSLHGSMLVPIHAYEAAFLKEIKSKAHRNFEKLKEKWGARVKTHLFVEHGSVAEGVRRFADKKKVDLIVIGTHGSSGLKEFTVGSNAEKIVRSAQVPVIAIKKFVNTTSLKSIVVPTDLNVASKDFIPSVKALQGFLKARIHLLYVNVPSHFTPDHVTEKRLIEFARTNQLKNCSIHIYNDIDEESGIMNFSAKFKNKAIAMSTHGRKGLNHLMRGSVAEDVVNHIDCPIWTLAAK
jgi:nucleotide-binding universal stress UspA family protein